MGPSPPPPEELSEVCRDIQIEYLNQVLKLGDVLFRLISEELKLNTNHLGDLDCDKGLAEEMIFKLNFLSYPQILTKSQLPCSLRQHLFHFRSRGCLLESYSSNEWRCFSGEVVRGDGGEDFSRGDAFPAKWVSAEEMFFRRIGF
ncbi:hypothetical protein L6452_22890 [Arctium lappa]|uniref:Uncharacterized protein n=1 Tax=Arctium lappa TaxID=4217 RepID=A0ACB9B2C1_ARCLA|nr:hypothetical protein L6452_22890 [Arctium lappa]